MNFNDFAINMIAGHFFTHPCIRIHSDADAIHASSFNCDMKDLLLLQPLKF